MSALPHSRLYQGLVTHTRLRPRRHHLRKRIPMVLIDLDEIGEINQSLRLFGVDRSAALSLASRQHLAGTPEPLKAQVERRLAEAGVRAGGAIRLMCMPAVFGRVFNPLSVYFCHRPDGDLAAVLYEVNNTFGRRHVYLLPAGDPDPSGRIAHGCRKAFHVSPFMDSPDLDYAFRLSPPGERADINIQVSDAEGVLLTASFSGAGAPLSDRHLAAVLARHPLLMAEVLGAIHWEAVKLLVKGLRLHPDPFRA